MSRPSLQITFYVSLTLISLSLSACWKAPAPTLISPSPSQSVIIASLQPVHPTDTATASPTLESSPTASPTASPTLVPTPLPTPTLPAGEELPLPQYTLNVKFDYLADRLWVYEVISYGNATSATLDDLLLVIPPNQWDGVFQLEALTWLDGSAIEGPQLDGHRLVIPFPQPLAPGATVSLALTYVLDLSLAPAPDDSWLTQPFGTTDQQTNLVDWYAYIPPYRQGWLTHDVSVLGEYQVYDVADFRVNLEVVDPPAGLVVAANTPAQVQDEQYHYQLDHARNFVFSASPDYHVISETVGEVVIYSYAYSASYEAQRAALDATSKALALYSELFAPYPRSTFSIAEADFPDGMEYDGLYFISNTYYHKYKGLPGNNLITIAVHETAHQWWFGRVGSDQAMQPWLDETLCTYAESLFYERVYPYTLTTWWWPRRVDYFHPAGWVGGSVYDYAAYRDYLNAVYLNGARFMEDLRQQIGDEAFFAFLKDYTLRFADRIATAEDFFAVLAEHTSVDLSDLLLKYFGSANFGAAPDAQP